MLECFFKSRWERIVNRKGDTEKKILLFSSNNKIEDYYILELLM